MLIKSLRYIALGLFLAGVAGAAKIDVLDHKYRTLAGKKQVDLRATYGGKVL
jgi:hypothetical protein